MDSLIVSENIISDNLTNALQEWENLLGSEYVSTDNKKRLEAETATYETHAKIPAIIRPGNRQEVQESLKIANRYQTPVYPISTGKNWGYGSRVPSRTGSVLMDLSRLNQILDYNETLAYVTIEAGVTQRQLYDFLQKNGNKLLMSVTGSTPDSSIIGNILERGEAKGPLGDRFNHVCGMEVVLPTGECVHTGFNRFENSQIGAVNRWGVGPYFDGIFTQSNLGIVTKMTFWLTPYPEYFQAFFYSIDQENKLELLIDKLRQLKMAGVIKTTFHINNNYRMLSIQQQYPWQECQEKTPLPPDLLEQLSHQWGGGVWIGEGALYSASPEQGKVERNLIEKALKGIVNKLMFFDENKFKMASKMSPIFKVFTGVEIKDKVDLIYHKNPQRGMITEKVLKMAYWRKKTPPTDRLNLDLDACGMIWCVPAVPFLGNHLRNALNIISSIAQKYGYEPNIGINCITERNININAAIFYDRLLEGEDQKALNCHDEMLAELINQGYYPYRLSTHSMNSLPAAQDDYSCLIQKIKDSLDPHRILSPGRYEFL
ncbi:MAG: FAD-binding oxidoreductase [Dolichospermum sp.]|jgi:4-cresol dehydrogenase (hydroxylating)|uniref:FAD-binding oxidoreductase n=1 Tax=Microcystis aeruginosa TaxID=1126 RepID=UPI00232B577C|nr:FAD-dependent oxidoreductase [Microcystis aeruginosa]MDB9392269.1 FAD-dependent oxidoreductase [Microcystis aeruginosa CS-579]